MHKTKTLFLSLAGVLFLVLGFALPVLAADPTETDCTTTSTGGTCTIWEWFDPANGTRYTVEVTCVSGLLSGSCQSAVSICEVGKECNPNKEIRPGVVDIYSIMPPGAAAPTGTKSAADCQKGDFFGLPTWYKYLEFNGNCEINYSQQITTTCTDPNNSSKTITCVNDKFDFGVIWGIGFAIIEMLLMLAGLIAMVFVVIGGFKFVMNLGSPETLKKARLTLANALVGAVIAVIGSKVVGFIARRFIAPGDAPYGLINTNADSGMVATILSIAFTALGGLSVLMLMFTGIQFIVSGSNPEKAKRAREGIYYSLLGIAVAIFASALVNFVLSRVT